MLKYRAERSEEQSDERSRSVAKQDEQIVRLLRRLGLDTPREDTSTGSVRRMRGTRPAAPRNDIH